MGNNACCGTGRPKKVTDEMDKPDNSNMPELTKVTFSCGEHCGFGCAPWESGMVHHIVNNSQAASKGIKAGWKIHSLDSQPYSFQLLMDKMKGRKSYEIGFVETDHFASEEKTFTFQAKSLGVKCEDWSKGLITEVSDGAGKEAGVQAGWTISKINGAKYVEALLDEKLEGEGDFDLTFKVPVRVPEYKEVTLEFTSGQLGIGCEDWDVGYVTDCMPDTQAHANGVKLGWKIEQLEGEEYVADLLDAKLDGEENYELTFKVPVDIVLEEKKPETVAPAEKVFDPPTDWKVVNGKGVVVREAQENADRSSPKVATLPFGEKLVADKLFGKRLHITSPVQGWVSLKNKKGYILVEQVEEAGEAEAEAETEAETETQKEEEAAE